MRCGSENAKLLALDRNSFNRILGQIDQYLHRDYSQEMKSFSIVFEQEQKQEEMFEDYTMFNHTVVAGWSPRGEDSMLQALKRDKIGSLPTRNISGISLI